MRAVISAILLLGLIGCSRSFWYRTPQVAGSYQRAPSTCPPTTCPPPSCPPDACAPAPCPPTTCPPPACPPTNCPPTPQIPPSTPSGCATRPPPASVGCGPTEEERCVLEAVNQIRCSQGLRPFTFDPQLYQAAYAHSEEQYRFGYMGHGSPDPSRRTLLQRIQTTGYNGRCFGEVVAWGYTSPRAVVEGWMNSRDHRAILVDRDLTQAGFSRVGEYWTGNFGTPRVAQPSTQPTFRVAPPTRPPTRTYAPAMRVPTTTKKTAPPPPAPAPTYVMPTPRTSPAPAPPVRSYFPPTPRPAPQPIYRVPARGG